MKKILSLFLILMFLPFALAIDINLEKTSNDETMIYGLDDSVKVDFKITNNGRSSLFTFYSIGDFSFSDFNQKVKSDNTVYVEKGETKEVSFLIFKRPDSTLSGKATFNYYVQASDNSEREMKLTINVLKLENAFEVGSSSIDPQTQSISIYIKNKANYNFDKLNVQFSSPFFEVNKDFDLKEYEKKEFKIDLKKSDFEELIAGFYTLNAKVSYEEITGNSQGKIEFLEKDILESRSRDYGFLISTNIIEKSNQGNTLVNTETKVTKNIFTRLFTTYSIEPTNVERIGFKIEYFWTQRLNPGESVIIKVKTNWLLPFLFVVLVIGLIYFTRKYITQKVVVRKKVSFVRAKGGEFALKVTLIAEARDFVEDVKIIDRLPPLVNIYERFAGELPDRISKDKKRLEWHYNYLEAGETRIMNYVVYSKVGVLGKFALPGATCRYKKAGKEKQSNSNKAFFISEQKHKRF